MASLYLWIKFIHVLAGFVFLLAHGTSIAMTFRLKREKDAARIAALLDLSAGTFPAMFISLLVILAAGIANGFMGQWWGRGWIWASLVILIGQTVWMSSLSGKTYHPLRKLAGMPYMEGRKEMPAQPARPMEEIQAAIAKTRPMELAVIGLGGFVIILWLMMFKPF